VGGRNGDERPPDEPSDHRKKRSLHPGDRHHDVGALDLFEPREEAQDSRDADVRDDGGGDAQVLEGPAAFLGGGRVRRSRRDDADAAFDFSHGLSDQEVKSSRARFVVRAAREWIRRDLLPRLGREPRHENVVRARELPADLRNLRGRLSVREDDLGKAHASKTIEVEREVLGHGADLTVGFAGAPPPAAQGSSLPSVGRLLALRAVGSDRLPWRHLASEPRSRNGVPKSGSEGSVRVPCFLARPGVSSLLFGIFDFQPAKGSG
jgi:hypothetical protein